MAAVEFEANTEERIEMRRLLGRRSAVALGVAALLVFGLVGPTRADEHPVPRPCTVHHVHVVNPGCVPALVDSVVDPPDTYPDLVPEVTQVVTFNPFVGVDPDTDEPLFGPLQLAFDTWSQNLGTVAVDLVSDEPTNLTNPSVSQCVSWAVDGACRQRRQVGGFEVHPTHNHFHFNDFAAYELRRLLPGGTPDYSTSGLIDGNEKVSFCLFDAQQVRSDARPVQTYSGCGSTREGISAGWADIYTADLDGQQLLIDGLPDGRYALVIKMDPFDRLYESDNGNNVLEATVELSNGLTEATIVARRWR